MPQKQRRWSLRRWSLRRWIGQGLLALVVGGALFVAGFYLLTVRPDRHSVPYRQAMERLRANRSAALLLGGPARAGWWVRGHAGADSARLAVPVSGPARGGVLHIEAQRAGRGWVFSTLTLAVADNNVRLSLTEAQHPRRQRDSSRTPALEVPPRYLE